MSVTRCPRCLKFSQNICVLEPTSKWVFSRKNLRKFPTTVGASVCRIHNLSCLITCSMQVWGKYSTKKAVSRYHSCFGKFLLARRDSRANWQSAFAIMYYFENKIVVTGRMYVIDIHIPLHIIFLIRFLGSIHIATFWLHVSAFSTSIYTCFPWIRWVLVRYPTTFPIDQAKCSVPLPLHWNIPLNGSFLDPPQKCFSLQTLSLYGISLIGLPIAVLFLLVRSYPSIVTLGNRRFGPFSHLTVFHLLMQFLQVFLYGVLYPRTFLYSVPLIPLSYIFYS